MNGGMFGGNNNNTGAVVVMENGIQFPDGSFMATAPIITGLRNRIINGAMLINQRAAASTTVNGAYLVDRWFLGSSNALTTLSSVADGTVSLVGNNHLNLQCNTVLAAPAVGDFSISSHRIEGFNVADFRFGKADAKRLVISFRARASVAGIYTLAVRNAANTRSYVTPITISTVPTTYTVSIPGDTTGVWAIDNTVGLEVNLTFSANTAGTFTTPNANLWQTGNFVAHSSQSNGLDTLNRNLAVSDFQLEVGVIATPFEIRDVQPEFSRCQRYYEQGTARIDAYNAAGAATSTWSNYKMSKRILPAVTLSGAGYSNGSGATVNANSSSEVLIITFITTALGASAMVTSWTSNSEL